MSFSASSNRDVYGAGLWYAFIPAIAGALEVQKPMSDITKFAVGVSFGY